MIETVTLARPLHVRPSADPDFPYPNGRRCIQIDFRGGALPSPRVGSNPEWISLNVARGRGNPNAFPRQRKDPSATFREEVIQSEYAKLLNKSSVTWGIPKCDGLIDLLPPEKNPHFCVKVSLSPSVPISRSQILINRILPRTVHENRQQ